MVDDVAAAYLIWKGEFVDVSKIVLPDFNTPEDMLIDRDIFRLLSEEAAFVCNLILQTPEEIFSLKDHSRVNWGKLYSVCRKQKHWSRSKVDSVIREVKRKMKRMRDGN